MLAAAAGRPEGRRRGIAAQHHQPRLAPLQVGIRHVCTSFFWSGFSTILGVVPFTNCLGVHCMARGIQLVMFALARGRVGRSVAAFRVTPSVVRRIWWYIVVLGAAWTGLMKPYVIAFEAHPGRRCANRLLPC